MSDVLMAVAFACMGLIILIAVCKLAAEAWAEREWSMVVMIILAAIAILSFGIGAGLREMGWLR